MKQTKKVVLIASVGSYIELSEHIKKFIQIKLRII